MRLVISTAAAKLIAACVVGLRCQGEAPLDVSHRSHLRLNTADEVLAVVDATVLMLNPDKRGFAAGWVVSGRKKGAVHAPKCFQACGCGRPWPPELPLVVLT